MPATTEFEYFIDVARSQRIKRKVISASSNGDNTVIAAVTGKVLRVYQVCLMAAGTTTVRWESGASGTALTGQIPLIVNAGYAPPFCPFGHFETAEAALLNLELSAGVAVTGWLVYAEV